MKRVLFVCTHNAGRSQMAQAYLERHAPPDLGAQSAGTDPARAIWPTVVEAMAEVGVDLSGRRPAKLDVETQLRADWAVTMNCGDACPYVPAHVEDWDVDDPAGRSLDEVRAIRDEIEGRVLELVHKRVDEIRADRTAHELRLQSLLPQLADEFGSIHAPDDIRACAEAVLARLEDSTVRSYITTLAHRQIRDCLRADFCAELATR